MKRLNGDELLVRVVSPYFCCGLILRDDVCVEAAPIMRWAIGKRRDDLSLRIRAKGWRATVVRENEPTR